MNDLRLLILILLLIFQFVLKNLKHFPFLTPQSGICGKSPNSTSTILCPGKSYRWDLSGNCILTCCALKIIKRMDHMDTLPPLNKKFISVSSLNDIEEEKKFWLSKGALERIQAIELNRRMVYGRDRITSRLQRFLETSELSRS